MPRKMKGRHCRMHMDVAINEGHDASGVRLEAGCRGLGDDKVHVRRRR